MKMFTWDAGRKAFALAENMSRFLAVILDRCCGQSNESRETTAFTQYVRNIKDVFRRNSRTRITCSDVMPFELSSKMLQLYFVELLEAYLSSDLQTPK